MEDGNSPLEQNFFPGLTASLASIAHLRTKDRDGLSSICLFTLYFLLFLTVNFIMHTVFWYGINSNNLSHTSCPLVIQNGLNKSITERRIAKSYSFIKNDPYHFTNVYTP